MEKTINIGNTPVKFKATASTAPRYRFKFGRDLLKDMTHLSNKYERAKKEQKEPALTEQELSIFLNLSYIMAQQADPENVPSDAWDWLDQFEVFPYADVFPEVMGLWGDSQMTIAESKNKVGGQ